VYKLHPVVVFSILDAYKRRNDGQDRVLGTLLGERRGNEVFITNAFRVPHGEEGDQVALDIDYHRTMLELHTRVNPDEQVIGWFSTGTKINYTSSEIHNVYAKECGESALSSGGAIMLTVDTALTNFRMGIQAFVAKTVKVGDRPVLARFERAPLEFHAFEAEKIGVDALINGTPDDKQLDAPATILSDFDALEVSSSRLLDYLEAVSSYVAKVVDGKVEGDSEVGRAIASALAAVPPVDPAVFDKMFSGNMQDLLMVVYLSNLTRTQLALADKISGIL